MKIENRMELEIKQPGNVEIVKVADKLIIYDENIVIKFKIFTDKYINNLLHEINFTI